MASDYENLISMSFEIFKTKEDKLDEFFKAGTDNSGKWVKVKLPWNKSYRWVKASMYRKFRLDILEATVEMKEDIKSLFEDLAIDCISDNGDLRRFLMEIKKL